MLDNASAALTELKKAGDSFAFRAKEVAEQMKASLQVSENYGREMKAQASAIADTSVKSAEILDNAASALSSRISDVSRAANDASLKVEGVREKMRELIARQTTSYFTRKTGDGRTLSVSIQLDLYGNLPRFSSSAVYSGTVSE